MVLVVNTVIIAMPISRVECLERNKKKNTNDYDHDHW